jgi:hypothetical protein
VSTAASPDVDPLFSWHGVPLPVYSGGNEVELLRGGDALFPAQIDAIRHARHEVWLATYIFHHYLWAHHQARMPRPGNYLSVVEDRQGPIMEFRSNLFYNWGGTASGYNSDTAARATYAFVDNLYRPGPDSRGRLAFREENSEARAHFSGNLMDGKLPGDPWELVDGSDRPGYRLPAPVDTAIRPEPADDAVATEVPAEKPSGVEIVSAPGSRTGRTRMDGI